MHRITPLETLCLLVTAGILALMVTDMVRHRSERRAWDEERKTMTAEYADPFTRNGHDEYTLSPDAPASGQTADVATLARHIPFPETSATGTPAVVATSAVTTVAGLTLPGAASTNEIVAELLRLAALPWTADTEQKLIAAVGKWAATDPLAALQFAMQLESRRARSALLSGIFGTWAKTDPNSAFNWLLANREADPVAFQSGLRPVLATLAASGLDNAMRLALEIAPGGDRMSALRILMGQAANGMNCASLLPYLDSLQSPGERQNFSSMLAQNWAIYNPTEATQWALSLTDPAQRKAAVSSAIGSWASDNPSAAAAWAVTLQDGDLRTAEIAQVARSWSQYDPIKTADWLLSLHPPAPYLDPAIQALVGTVSRSNPEGAVMWASTISDPRARSSAIVNASREWMRMDPAKASAYIASAPLTPDQKNRLLHGR